MRDPPIAERLRPFGIVEMVRTGRTAMGRGDRALCAGDALAPVSALAS